MATLHENENTFSTLELFQNDDTARAPEPNPVPAMIGAGFEIAPEIVSGTSAPETLPGRGPEVLYSTLLPEVVADRGTIPQPETSTLTEAASSKRTKIIFAALAVFLLSAIAIGLGVGLRKARGKYSGSPAAARPSAVPDPVNTTIPAAPANPVNSSITQQILNGTSLAAVTIGGGDRHLFFQDLNGLIQQMVYTASEDQWIVNTNPIGISDARYLTPMAADTQEEEDVTSIHLYYISASNHLSSRTYTSGVWWQSDEGLSNYTASPSSRQLSITSTNSTGDIPANETVNQSLLLYEDLLGNVTALLRVASQAAEPCDILALTCLELGLGIESHWIDISSNNKSKSRSDFLPIYGNTVDGYSSSTLYESDPVNRFSAPFASAPLPFLNQSNLVVDMLFCGDNCNPFLWVDYNSYTNSSHEILVAMNKPLTNLTESDLVIVSPPGGIFAVWVKGTQPAVIGYNSPNTSYLDTAPAGPFPYNRLAGITWANQTESYLYHQINGTTFAEEQYRPDLNQWMTSSHITVPSFWYSY